MPGSFFCSPCDIMESCIGLRKPFCSKVRGLFDIAIMSMLCGVEWLDDSRMMNGKEYKRMLSWLNRDIFPLFAWGGWRRSGNTSVEITGIPAGSQTDNLLYPSLDSYHCIIPLGASEHWRSQLLMRYVCTCMQPVYVVLSRLPLRYCWALSTNFKTSA
jgi:hypothetical protein